MKELCIGRKEYTKFFLGGNIENLGDFHILKEDGLYIELPPENADLLSREEQRAILELDEGEEPTDRKCILSFPCSIDTLLSFQRKQGNSRWLDRRALASHFPEKNFLFFGCLEAFKLSWLNDSADLNHEFADEAYAMLECINQQQLGSAAGAYALANAGRALIEHWLIVGDLRCGARSESVTDFLARLAQPNRTKSDEDEIDFMSESIWIRRIDVVRLLKLEQMKVPSFLLKYDELMSPAKTAPCDAKHTPPSPVEPPSDAAMKLRAPRAPENRPNNWDETGLRRLLCEFRDGATQRELGARYGVTRQRVAALLKRASIAYSPRSATPFDSVLLRNNKK